MNKPRSSQGYLSLIVLWALVILSILTLSISRGVRSDMILLKRYKSKIQSRYLAWSGIMRVMDRLAREPQGSAGRVLQGDFAGGFFKADVSPGEELLNLNALDQNNIDIFIHLLRILNLSETRAREIAFAVLDWIDRDSRESFSGYEAEEKYYHTLENPYPCKNAPLDSLNELFLIRGINKEIFCLIKDYVTIIPYTDRLVIDFDNAPEAVLKALARHKTGPLTNADEDDADSLVEKILRFREENRPLPDVPRIALNAKEKILWGAMRTFRSKGARYIRVRSLGQTRYQNTRTILEAVIRRDRLSFVSFREF